MLGYEYAIKTLDETKIYDFSCVLIDFLELPVNTTTIRKKEIIMENIKFPTGFSDKYIIKKISTISSLLYIQEYKLIGFLPWEGNTKVKIYSKIQNEVLMGSKKFSEWLN
jgi:hypothetical protein